MRRKKLFVMMVAVLCLLFTATLRAEEKVIKICDDEAGWPPFTFEDTKSKGQVTGASTDVLVEILKRAGYKAQISLLPWKRCLDEVEKGVSAMLINAAYSDERAQKYLLTKPLYSISSGLFYTKKRFPVKPQINTITEMNKYTYCGLLGYNYTMYKIDPKKLDTGAKNVEMCFAKLQLGRCDFALGDIEILKGFEAMKQLDLSGIDLIPIPESKPKEFFMLVTKAASGGDNLLQILNKGLENLRKDGTYKKIFAKYGINVK